MSPDAGRRTLRLRRVAIEADRFPALPLFSCVHRWNAADIISDAATPRSPPRKVSLSRLWVRAHRARARNLSRIRDAQFVQGDRRGSPRNGLTCRADSGACAGGGSQKAHGPELVD